MLNKHMTISSLLKNPLGDDVVTIMTEQLGISKDFLRNPIVGSLSLGMLQKLSGGFLDDHFIEVLSRKVAEYHHIDIPRKQWPVKHKWWKEAVAYQIYPRSFMDSNGDGIGDLQGIKQRLDYLKGLGVNLLWLSPIYDSPNDDNGYDIRDYYKIMDEFGTMEDFNSLLEEAHRRDIRLIMDLVVNHTSDEHYWFRESKKGEKNPYRNYYIWKKGKGQHPPNNWTSFFSGSAWNYYEETDSFGLHLFSKKMMDLNWDHKPMRQEIYKMIRYWLDKGIDGFRLDVINYISKPEDLPHGSNLIGQLIGYYGVEHYFYGPHLHDYLKEMRRETFDHYDVVTIGEAPGLARRLSQLLTHEDRKELDMVFSFEHLSQLQHAHKEDFRFDLNHLKEVFIKWQTKYDAQCWNSLFYDNHDNPRILSKIDPEGRYRTELGKLLGMLQLTLKGTPFIYQGQELGLVNGIFNSIEDYRDVESINLYNELKRRGVEEDVILRTLHASTRDHARIVMPWSDGPGSGFTTGEPWIKASIADSSISYEREAADPHSVYHFYRQMIQIRRTHKDLVYGDFEAVHKKRRDYFAYYRHGREKTYFIDMNLSAQTIRPIEKTHQYQRVLGNYETESNLLRPYECRLYEVVL